MMSDIFWLLIEISFILLVVLSCVYLVEGFVESSIKLVNEGISFGNVMPMLLCGFVLIVVGSFFKKF